MTGDDVGSRLDDFRQQGLKFKNLDTGEEDLDRIADKIVAAHVYVGSEKAAASVAVASEAATSEATAFKATASMVATFMVTASEATTSVAIASRATTFAVAKPSVAARPSKAASS